MTLPSIRIDTGVKRIAINDDPDRVIEFNPTDAVWVEKFFRLFRDLQAKLDEYHKRYEKLAGDTSVDASGIPVSAEAQIELLKETCDYLRSKIDDLFGDGAAQTVFGDTRNLDVFVQFFDGMTPYIESARSPMVDKYLPKK